MSHFLFFISLISLVVIGIDGLPGGAPTIACESLLPRHGNNIAQTGPSPFQILVNSTNVENGEVIEVTVESDDPTKTFKGFLLQAREVATVYETKGIFVTEEGSEIKTNNCQVDSDTVTHISRDDKRNVKFYYKAPDGYEGVVTITGTVVEKFDTFHEKVQSEQITVSNGQISTEVPTSTETSSTNETFFDGCGTTKSCFGQPDNCIDRQSCNFATTVAKSLNGSYIFELISYQRQARYVAVALSLAEFMSEASVMECVRESNRQIKKYDSWMTVRPQRGVSRENVLQDTTNSIWTDIDEQMFICRFERQATTVVREETFDLDNTRYHLLLASGTELIENGIGPHDLGAKASDKRLLGDIQAFGTPSTLFFKLHGVFMFTAWVGTTTIGVFFARYYKKQWKGKQLMNKDLWFVGHQTSMILTWLFTMVGFILIFVKIQAWSDSKNPHPILGVITTVLCFLQPIGAIFRPTPNHRNRRWFNWIHFVAGNTAHLLGIISIFFAVSLPKANLPFEMYYIMIGFGAYYAVAHVLCSIATEPENLKQYEAENASWWKNVLLILHVAIVLTFNVVGVVLIIKGDEATEM